MVTRIILLIIIIFAFVAIFGNLTSQAGMSKAVENIQASVATMAYAGEFSEIQQIVNEFLHLREIRSLDGAKEYADKLDERINNLGLVKMYCQQRISTLELAFEQDPYEKVQQICPAMKNVSFVKAVELFNLI
ncbi:MAG TPA: hypothetical protein VJJ25_03990 [Nitrosopumilaceae archaeon]|nr:hypothetical protein [Nitrosopumilaceae archaeon]